MKLTQITNLESEYRSTSCETTLKKIVALRSEYNSILSKNVSRQLMYIRQRQFEIGDRPQKLLARQLKHSQATCAIHKIKSNNGKITVDPQKIISIEKFINQNVKQAKRQWKIFFLI